MSVEAPKSRPQWLNNELLQKAFRSYHKDDTINIVDIQLRENFTEHFGSEMISCGITYNRASQTTQSCLNIVIKAFPAQDDYKAKVLADSPFFHTEIRMYTETLPIINDLFLQSGLKRELAPELIYATEQPFPLLMLRDMRDEGLTALQTAPEHLDDTKLIFQRLAQFHAASFYLSETNQHNFDEYSYTYYENPAIIEAFFIDAMRAFREVVAADFQGYESYVPEIDYLIANVGEIGRRCYVKNAPGAGFNVLNHGDFHLRNLLTKFSSVGRLERFQFIDYQLCIHCSPAIDLGYIFSITKCDVEDGSFHEDELIMHYHGEFVRSLKLFGFLGQPPSLLDLNVEILKHSAFVMILKIVFLPFAFVDWSEMSADDIMGIEEDRAASYKLKVKILKNPLCQRMLKQGLKEWAAKGYL